MDEYVLRCHECFAECLLDPDDLLTLRKHSIACPLCDSPATEVTLRFS